MRDLFVAGALAVASLAPAPVAAQPPSSPQTPAAAKRPSPDAAVPAGAAAPKPQGGEGAAKAGPAPSPMEAPKLPPFAGEIVNFDRRGDKVAACVDAAKVDAPPRLGPDGKPLADDTPRPPPGPPRLRIWVIEREVMQELLTTSGLCDPAWAPDGKGFAAAGARGVFVFLEPNFEPRVLVAGVTQAPAPGAATPRAYDDPAWSPSGARLAFRSSDGTAARVEVVDVKSAEVLLKREGAAKVLRWADERTLLVDGARVVLP